MTFKKKLAVSALVLVVVAASFTGGYFYRDKKMTHYDWVGYNVAYDPITKTTSLKFNHCITYINLDEKNTAELARELAR